jgi:hypothetical protein
MPGRHTFSSKAQWRFAFAKFGDKVGDWPRRWAEANKATKPFKTLPPRKSIRKKV